MLQVLPRNEQERAVLERDFERFRIDKAIAYRKRLLERDPGDVASHSALASTYLYIDRPELAIPHLERALRVEPDNPGLHQNLAYALRRAGRPAEAVAHYERALAIDPGSADSAFDLAQVLRSLARFDQALELYRRAAGLRPEMPAPLVAASELLVEYPSLAADGTAEAVRLAERAVRLTAERDLGALETLARAYRADGRVQDAEQTRRLIEKNTIPAGEEEAR
jgi:tetratricopeptide (TPR) repeat protein